MKKLIVNLLLTLMICGILIVAYSSSSIAAGNGADFIITNADGQSYLNISTPDGINLNVDPRMVVEFSNSLKTYSLGPLDTALASIIENVAPRFIIQYGNSIRFYSISYPTLLFGDTTPPQVINIEIQHIQSHSIIISVTTNEYTQATLHYGNQPGIYPNQIDAPLFKKDHQLQVNNILPGVTYFFVVDLKDRSGNQTITDPGTFTGDVYLYLPAVQK